LCYWNSVSTKVPEYAPVAVRLGGVTVTEPVPVHVFVYTDATVSFTENRLRAAERLPLDPACGVVPVPR